MKMKNVFWLVSGIVAVVCLAAGAALFISRFLGLAPSNNAYIECDCEEETDTE